VTTFSINVLLADDHPILLLGIRQMLSITSTIHVVGTARNSSELLRMLDEVECNVLVTDYSMPGGEHGDGIALIDLVRRRYPDMRIVVLTMMANAGVLHTLARHRIECIVSKADDPTNLVPAIHAAHCGGRYYSPSIDQVMRALEHAVLPGRVGMLSVRESEVLRLLATGMTIGEVAAHLHRSNRTISTQKNSAMKKLGIQRDVDLLKYMIDVGLTSSTDRPPASTDDPVGGFPNRQM
jgi:two-component system, NarL family, captular synthesis response regulator RcsB